MKNPETCKKIIKIHTQKWEKYIDGQHKKTVKEYRKQSGSNPVNAYLSHNILSEYCLLVS